MSGPFRFAVGADGQSADEWCSIARRAEALGYSTLFVADHYNLPAGNPIYPHQHLAPLTAMAVAATSTTTLRIGALSDSSLVAVPVGHVRRVVCASPALLKQAGLTAGVDGCRAGWILLLRIDRQHRRELAWSLASER